MADDTFDALAKSAAKSVNRRQMLLSLRTGLGAMLFALFGASTAFAQGPQTCVTCTCGTGKPCNPRSTVCTEVRGFPADQTCSQACARKGQNLCSTGTAYHCPKGCP
jgi:hypothetical protein